MIDSTAWNDAGQGVVTITFFANDTAGNEAFLSIQINKDTIDPETPNSLTANPDS
jgi:hypothetical protein